MSFCNPTFTPIQGPLGRGRPFCFATQPNNCPPFQHEFSQFSPRSPLHEYDVLRLSRPIMNPPTPPPTSAFTPPTLHSLPTSQWGPVRHIAPPAMTIGPVPMNMHAVPYDPVQNSRVSSSSPLFYPTIQQVPKMNIGQFTANCQRAEKIQDWESAFERAATRHGIKIQEAPKAHLGTCNTASKSKSSKPAYSSTKTSLNIKESESVKTNLTSTNSVQSQSKEKMDGLQKKDSTISASRNCFQSKVSDKPNDNNVPDKDDLHSKNDHSNSDNRSCNSDSYQSQGENSRFIYVSEDEFESDSNETSSPPVDRRRKIGEDSSDWLVSGSSVESSPDSSPVAASSEIELPDMRSQEENSGGLLESGNVEEIDSHSPLEASEIATAEVNGTAVESECLDNGSSKENSSNQRPNVTTLVKLDKESQEWMESYYTEENSSVYNAVYPMPCEAEIEQFIVDTIEAVVQNLLKEMSEKTDNSLREVLKAKEPVAANNHTLSDSHVIQDGTTCSTEDNSGVQKPVELENLTCYKSEMSVESNNNCEDQSLPGYKQHTNQKTDDHFNSTELYDKVVSSQHCPNEAKSSVLSFVHGNAKEIISEPSSSSGEGNDFDGNDDIFVKLALQKGIKVGNRLPVENKESVPPDSTDHESDFERLAAKNGIRIGSSPSLSKQSSPLKEKNKKTDCYDDMFERFAAKNGIRIGSSGPQHNMSSVPQEFIPPTPSLHVPNPIPMSPTAFQIPCLIKPHFVPELQLQLDSQIMASKTNKTKASLSFEQMASKHGIKIGSKKADVDCQTDQHIFHSRASQTCNLIKIKHQSVQVDVNQNAFKDEFNTWMQEELNIVDPTAASFRGLYQDEVKARVEAERRLEVEMDKNVKLQRTTKMQINELKQQLQNQEETIEKLSKELKSTKKQKDNEIKKLTKDLKLRAEDIANLNHEIHLKDVAIENINLISNDQTTKIQKLEDQIKHMESEMEKEQKKNRPFVVEPKKEAPKQVKTDEWQVVKGRSSKIKLSPRWNHINHIDSLSEFNDHDAFANCNNKYLGAHDNDDRNSQAQSSSGWSDQEDVNSRSRSSSFHQQLDLNDRSNFDHDSTLSNTTINLSSKDHLSRPNSQTSLSSPRLSDSSSSADAGNVYNVSPPSNSSRFCMSHSSTEVGSAYSGNPLLSSPRLRQSCSITEAGNVNSSLNLPVCSPTTRTVSSGSDLTNIHCTPSGFASCSLPTTMPPLFTRIHPNMYLPPPPPISAATTGSSATHLPLPTRKIKTAKQQPGSKLFDELMDALRDQFPDYSRPLLMVYLNKAKFSYGSTGFDGKEITEIVDRVSQIINRESISRRT